MIRYAEYVEEMRKIDALMAEIAELDEKCDELRRQELLARVKECEQFEREHFPIPSPTPEQAAAYHVCQERRCAPTCEFCK